MHIRVSVRQRDLVISAFLTAILLAAGLFVFSARASYEQSQAKFYSGQLKQLKTAVQEINALNSRHPQHSEDSLPEQIGKYQTSLAAMLKNCRNLDARYKDIKEAPRAQSLRERIDNANKLCQDLKTVLEYAAGQSEATEAFMAFQADMLSAPQADKKLAELQPVLDSAIKNLEGLKSNKVQDPGLTEQIALLQEVRQLSANAPGNPEVAAGLAQKIKTHQNNLLNARAYFWTNTINIAALERSIDTLQNSF